MACNRNIITGPIRVTPIDYGGGNPPPQNPSIVDINDLSGDVQSGRSGISGFSGYSGMRGISGESGRSGRSGYSGPSGISGFSGFGVNGESGYSGHSGESGESGRSGYSGFIGASGPSGLSGFSGSTGSGIQEKNIYNTFSSSYGLMPYTVKVGRSSCLNYPAAGTYALDFHLDIPEDFVIGTDCHLVFNYNMSTAFAGQFVLKLEMDVINQNGTAIPGAPVYTTTDIITPNPGSYINEELIYIISSTYITDIHQSIRFTLSRLADNVNDTHGGDFNVENTSLRYTGFGTASGTSGFSGFSGFSGAGFSGPSGPSGFSGFSGSNGIIGSNGVSGFSGFSSSSGVSGYSGISGFSGFSGLGASGFSGHSGVSGISGFSGLSGTSGVSGLSGTSGFSGTFSGFSGHSGTSGTSGFSGTIIGTSENVNIVKQTSESRTSTTILPDSELTTILEGNTSYIVEGLIRVSAPSSTPDFAFYLTYSADMDLTGSWVNCTLDNATTIGTPSTGSSTNAQALEINFNNSTYMTIQLSNTIDAVIRLNGRLKTTTPGTFRLEWGQLNTDVVNATTVRAGSYFQFTKGSGALSGFSGLSGTSGFSGTFSGFSGFSGIGTSGFSGLSGTSGTSGFSGAFSGISGFSGVSGFSGLGFSGPSGPSGISGFSGLSGTSGFSGAFSGISGFSGVSGFSGYSGTSGFSGAVGGGYDPVTDPFLLALL